MTEEDMSMSTPTALVDAKNPGAGILVDTKTVGRPVGDTSTGAVWVTDLPTRMHGGQASLQFALGELFSNFGKIKEIKVYIEKDANDMGGLGCQKSVADTAFEEGNLTGNALVVYHKTKHTGSHDRGDPVYDACTELDGKVRVLGKRHWRIRCEAAAWQKEGFNVKSKAKLVPCVELVNLYDYDPNVSLQFYMQMQDAIREQASLYVQNPFVKLEPTSATVHIWTKGAQDAMKLARQLGAQYFLGRKIQAALCRKEKPKSDGLPTLKSLGIATVGEEEPVKVPMKVSAEAPLPAAVSPDGQGQFSFRLKPGAKVRLKGLRSKPENNGKTGKIGHFAPDVQKYQIMLDDGRVVKVKSDNLEPYVPGIDDPEVSEEEAIAAMEAEMAELAGAQAEEAAETAKAAKEAAEAAKEAAEEAEEAASAEAAAAQMATKIRPEVKAEADVDFTPTVCVDPSLLPKREAEEAKKREEEERQREEQRRARSRSRERILKDRIAAAKARIDADTGSRPKWIVSNEELAQQMAAAAAGGAAKSKEPPESREELLKMSVAQLKSKLREYGKSAMGCLEKKDFVDRLKPSA